MDKRILIINASGHNAAGGMETYSKNIIDIFLNDNNYVFEYPIFKDTSEDLEKINNEKYHLVIKHFKMDKNGKFSFLNPLWYLIGNAKRNKFIRKFIKENKIDTVINNFWLVPALKCDEGVRHIWVQHQDWSFFRFGNTLLRFFKKIFFLRDNWSIPNIVVYSKNDKKYLLENKLIKNNTNIHIIPLTTSAASEERKKQIDRERERERERDLSNKTQIAFVGRLVDEQKNIAFLNKLTNYANSVSKELKIFVYGKGPDENLIDSNPDISYKGEFDNDVVDEIFKNIKILLLPSRLEGFGYVIVEAFSNGTPCIVANTFLNASYLINDSRGKLIDGFDPQT